MAKQAEIAPSKKDGHKTGVKGPTVVSKLPGIDISSAVNPEYMHSVLLGVVRQFLSYWITVPGFWKFTSEAVKSFNNAILKITPPNTFCRYTRNITDFVQYKASELYNFLLFYSLPVLQKYLSKERFQHWMCLVIGIYLLLKMEITEHDLTTCEYLLEEFVMGVESLYDERALTYNVHQLLHLPLYCRRAGNLWATSAFYFEHLNGILAHMTHGTHHVIQEIANNISIIKSFDNFKTLGDYPHIFEKNKKDSDRTLGKAFSPGKCLSDFQESHFSHENIDLKDIKIYLRSEIDGKVFTSVKYKADQLKTNSYTVEFLTADKLHYGIIHLFFKKDNDPELYFLVEPLKVEHAKMFFYEKAALENNQIIKAGHVLPVKESGELRIIKCSDIKGSIHHLVRIENYVCRAPNHLKVGIF